MYCGMFYFSGSFDSCSSDQCNILLRMFVIKLYHMYQQYDFQTVKIQL